MAGTILSADIGTSSLKAAFIDLDGRLLAFSRAAYRWDTHGVLGAEAWEQAFVRALENLHAQAPDCGIDGVCISGNGPTLVPMTGEGEALAPLYWHDGRTLPPKNGPAQSSAAEASSFFLPRAAWLKENSQAEYERTSVFVSSHEWLAHRLGAGILTVLPQTAYEPYYWDDEQCRLFGLEREKFPPFVKMGTVMGCLSPQAVSFFGPASGSRLKSGIPIIAGGPDFITALIGTGTLKPGDVCDRAGSSEGINVCADGPVKDPSPAGKNSTARDAGFAKDDIRVLPHVREGLWNIGKVISSSGRLFEWYRSSTDQEGRDYAGHLAELIPSTETTNVFRNLEFLPPAGKLSPDANSSLLVPPSSFHAPRSRLDLGRAVLCAMGFAVRNAIETLEARGFTVREMRVSGGQAKNPRWNQLKADITGLTLMVPEIPDGELAGNAVLSAAALGAASTFEEAANRMIRIREIFRPGNPVFWEERYRFYKESETGL